MVVDRALSDMSILSLSKLFDSKGDTLGLKKLQNDLKNCGLAKEAQLIEELRGQQSELVERIRCIRNKSISHNDVMLTRNDAFEKGNVTPDEIRELIDQVCDVLNKVNGQLECLDISHNLDISKSQRFECATLAVLETLKRGE